MHCPYCRQVLEPLIIAGRQTGAYQCLNCRGAWLRYLQLTDLLPPGTQGLLPAPSSPPPPLPSGPMSLAPHSTTPLSGQGPVWPPMGPAAGPSPWPPPQAAPPPRPRGVFWWRKAEPDRPQVNQDWDICTYCGKQYPGAGRHCLHCNIERMGCPQCGSIMVGVRRYGVLVDLCIRCQGLFFEKGRLEALMERMHRGGEPTAPQLPGTPTPSLLQQLAAFFEETEPDIYSTRDEHRGIFGSMASAVSAGLGSSKSVLYDLLVMLGDIQTPGGGPRNPGK